MDMVELPPILHKSTTLDKVHIWTYTDVEEPPMSPTPTLVRKVDPKTASGPALKAFFRIADRWKLDVEQQLILLGEPARSTFFKWKKDQGGNLREFRICWGFSKPCISSSPMRTPRTPG